MARRRASQSDSADRARTAVRESYSFLLAVMQVRDGNTRVCVVFVSLASVLMNKAFAFQAY